MILYINKVKVSPDYKSMVRPVCGKEIRDVPVSLSFLRNANFAAGMSEKHLKSIHIISRFNAYFNWIEQRSQIYNSKQKILDTSKSVISEIYHW